MRTISNYLIIMFLVMLFVFRLIVIFTSVLGIEFIVTPINVKYEMILLFIMIICIILITKNKLSGAIILVVSSFAYYGYDLLETVNYILENSISIETAIQTVISLICLIIPIFAFFIVAFAKEQEKRPVHKKTDFFYKNESYDRKLDERVDKNNYRIM